MFTLIVNHTNEKANARGRLKETTVHGKQDFEEICEEGGMRYEQKKKEERLNDE
jgi:hypothetical protein